VKQYCDQCCNLVAHTIQCPSCGMNLCYDCYCNYHPCTADLPEEIEVRVEEPHELGR
jgi:NMD protein affecting ribosome stability and mRNA decay